MDHQQVVFLRSESRHLLGKFGQRPARVDAPQKRLGKTLRFGLSI
jgi:hypothetical protein